MSTLKGRTISQSVRKSSRVLFPKHGRAENESATSLRSHLMCIVATLVAAVIFTLTEHDDHQHTLWCAFEILMQTVLVALGTAYFRTRDRLLPHSSLLMPPLLMVSAFSLLCEPFQRLFFSHGHSFEVLIMHSQCNLMLGLAVCGFRRTFQRLAMLIAVFLTIFCCSISNASGLIPLTVLFAILSVGWLVTTWWDTVYLRMADDHERSGFRLWTAAGVAVLVLVLLVPTVGFGGNSLTRVIEGFLPGAGGTGKYDPFARGGINDGDALVAGNQDIRSFAPLEDAPFIDSPKPSLHDVFNDQFDEPPKKIKDQQRAVALPAELMVHVHRKMAEAKQAGREFSVIRGQSKPRESTIQDMNSPALFYVAGPVPVRFRMEVYEHFDGITWYPLGDGLTESAPMPPHVRMKQVEDRHWLDVAVSGQAYDAFAGTATHSLKIVNLEGNVIPTPPHLDGINIRHVDRADMYQISTAGIASMRRKSVPEMTPVNLVSRYLVRDRLKNSNYAAVSGYRSDRPDVTNAMPQSSETDRLHQLAVRWTQGLPKGWLQMQAIESQLKKSFVLDRSVRANADSDTPLADFLFEDRRGPEYLFASSAAALLRTLGYRTRLVSGFYARPDNYDSQKQHTGVFAADAHFWCEVDVGMNTWVTIEASPGYEIAKPPAGLLGQVWNAVLAVGSFVVHNAIAVLLSLGIVALGWLNRNRLMDLLLTVQWWLTGRSDEQRQAVRLGSLIDRRLQLARLPRNAGTTLRRWARQSVFEEVRSDLVRVAEIADRALFSPTEAVTDSVELQRLAKVLSYRRLKQLAKQSVNTSG